MRLALLEVFVLVAMAIVVGTMLYISLSEPGSVWDLFHFPALLRIIGSTISICLIAAFCVTVAAYALAFYAHAYIPHSAPLLISSLLSFYLVSYYFTLLGWRALWGQTGLLHHLPIIRLLNGVFDYGSPAIIAVMTLRYLPVGILLTYLRLRSLSVRKIHAARNLGIHPWSIHTSLYLPWSRPALSLVFLFTLIFGSLDNLASSVAGGGSVQIVANLIDDWHRSHLFQGWAMRLGLCYVAVVGVFVFLTLRLVYRGQIGDVTDVADSQPISYYGIEFVLFFASTVAIVLAEFSLVAGVVFLAIGGNTSNFPSLATILQIIRDEELWLAILEGIRISFVSAAAGAGLAAVSALACHLRENAARIPGKQLIRTNEVLLLIPFIYPPLLLGIVAGAFQGQVLGYYGSAVSLAVANTIMFGPLAYFVIRAGLKQLPSNCYLAAKNLDVGFGTYVTSIFLRACRFTLPTGFLLIFAFSLNESLLARYIGGTARPLGLLIADKKMAALEPHHFAAMTLLFVLTLGLLFFASLIINRRPSTNE